ncbi:MAG: PTS transporter subunit EIIC [Breznakia sp.]
MGGASSTIALLIGLLVFSKIPEQQSISRMATPVAVFNISEPTLFGVPVVLNPVYFIPLTLTGGIQAILGYYLTV